ncbi:hypothetical protein [Rhodococcus sp. IEGM 1408]|nr:hypothetical protein [Rhodococcus sp. IEGM 1408]MDV8002260.1 hypothetical protein [Rhodococcus sp. IEGM 1408]
MEKDGDLDGDDRATRSTTRTATWTTTTIRAAADRTQIYRYRPV